MIGVTDILLLVDKVFFVLPRVVLNTIFPPFSKFEKIILEKIINMLDESKSNILAEHVAEINYIQRDADDRRIRMYKFFPFKYIWKRKLYFENKHESGFTICKFQIIFLNGKKIHGALKSINGVFSVIDFGDNASDYRGITGFSLKIHEH